LGSAQARRRGARAAAVKVAVVGGGLAGLAAALDLVDAGHAVTVYEARPTLGGAVQTLPEREGDPTPPPDNGQHIALGCFTEYLAFLDRIGSAGRVKRLRLELTVIDERGRGAKIGYGVGPLFSYGHLGVGERLPIAPLGEMNGDAAWRALEQAGARVQTGVRIDDLDELASDAVVLALPPDDAARLLGARPNGVDYSPIVSVHLLFDRAILREPLAALLGSDAHWVFDRSALTGLSPSGKAPVRDSGPVEGRNQRGASVEVPPWPPGAQYLTVVSSAAPELLEIRGRELVDRI